MNHPFCKFTENSFYLVVQYIIEQDNTKLFTNKIFISKKFNVHYVQTIKQKKITEM